MTDKTQALTDERRRLAAYTKGVGFGVAYGLAERLKLMECIRDFADEFGPVRLIKEKHADIIKAAREAK